MTGRYPLIWGGEWGFSDERHEIDNIKYRGRLLDQIREHHAAGRIIVLTYHQACPTIGEPCDFVGGVQRKVSSADWDSILTEGTDLHSVWCECVDRLAQAIDTLKQEGIPIIFRPYHEMNGNWFWWGGYPSRFKALWSMLYHRFVNVQGLDNLLWAWNPDKPYAGVEEYFPGLGAVDFLGTDIYPDLNRKEVYPQDWYDRMLALAGDKPLALSEMSVLPNLSEFHRQPWAWFMGWDAMLFRSNTPQQLREHFGDKRVLTDRRPDL
jgi:mannan endo-1,4-beta-mannosidase